MAPRGRPGRPEGALAFLAQQAWQSPPTPFAQVLRPLGWLFALLAALHRAWWRFVRRPLPMPVPVVVVGNIVVGGTGKTPVVIATVQALRAAGRRPGVISRGHGRAARGVLTVRPDSGPAEVGDEPLVIRRRTGVPVWVGRQRVDAARALCAAHPEVDVLVSDDGLQHHALARVAELIVFDGRGIGNGLRLPAGPLRSAVPRRLRPGSWVLYNAERPSATLPGTLVRPQATRALPLAAWWQGKDDAATPLEALRGRPLVALAGIGDPEKFFAALEQAGLQIERCPLPDHAPYHTLPWPAGTTEVITTEKDAVKLPPERVGATKVWVVPLDLALPADLLRALLQRLGAAPIA